MAEWTYRCEYVCCGRCGRRCAHGPYWYRYRREGGKLKKEYCGKDDPRPAWMRERGRSAAELAEWWQPMLNGRTASERLALRVLGLEEAESRDQVYGAYKRMQLEHHPDRGGIQSRCQAINAAWSYLNAWWGW